MANDFHPHCPGGVHLGSTPEGKYISAPELKYIDRELPYFALRGDLNHQEMVTLKE